MGETNNITMTLKSKFAVKLTADKAANRVLFAEADKDFVDFLFHIHMLSVGIVSQLVCSVSDDALGSLRNITDSIRNLPNRYMISDRKSLLLEPYVHNCMKKLKVSSASKVPHHRTGYRCHGSHIDRWVVLLDDPHSQCPCCNRMRVTTYKVMEPSGEAVEMLPDEECGHVKGLATYIVVNDLTVQPMMFDSCYNLLRELKVKHLEDIEEKVVDVNTEACKKLLEVAIRSKTVLTDTFLPKKQPLNSPSPRPPVML
ncbi:hypothetical protein MLD38_011184 [Melastoma candidum]|uniref:Uncharacterized protein n=1 Tax=Melastoma candidum TaxID=119954 RepID=A0ACB9R3D7_9MYRT|nr:hypothetical protein MLD38_011184 [Melastoma candidum]